MTIKFERRWKTIKITVILPWFRGKRKVPAKKQRDAEAV